jgi:hypothetical protein
MRAIVRDPDLRWWWTTALAAVLVVWVVGVASGLAFFDESEHVVLARIAFTRTHPEIWFGQQIGGWAMIVAAVAIATHVIWSLALQPHGITPLLTSVVAALAGMVMVPGWSAWAAGMHELPGAHLTWWFFAVLASGVVVAACGVLLWRIALADRQRERSERIFLARGRIGAVEPRGGTHDRQGADERRVHPE